MTPTSVLPPLPLVGRDAELDAIRDCLEMTGQGQGRTLLLTGEGGIGKTRLAQVARDEALRRDWNFAIGRANEVEADLPYALFADVLLPTIETLSDRARAVLTGGVLNELAVLFPSLASMQPSDKPMAPVARETDFRNRLFWNFAQVMSGLTQQTPLVVVLEDLHWADPTSLELTHFLARQTATDRVAFVCTYRDDGGVSAPVQTFVRSLVSLSAGSVVRIGPLTLQDTDELVRTLFGVPAAMSRPFTALLYGWTRGNPFFIEEVLKTLVETGRLRKVGGTWLGWELETLELPDSVRETVMRRVKGLGADAREVAEMVAVMGTRVRLDVLESVTGRSAPDLLPVLDELAAHGVLADTDPGETVSWTFGHPIIRETMYAGLGRMRAGVLHGTVASSLESHYGESAVEHAGELAYHLSRSIGRGLAEKTMRYLEVAGRQALKTYANQEALNYLQAALDRAEAASDHKATPSLISALAHAEQRLGRTADAIRHWERARDLHIEADDPSSVARVQRRLGLAWYWTGAAANALREFEAGSEAAIRAGDNAMLAGLRVARGLCLQELGRASDALAELEAALSLAESVGHAPLLARVHRALLLIYLWTGPSDVAREHGEKALVLANEADDSVLSFWVHWALAVLAGLTGDSGGMADHLSDCQGIADELRSPVHQIWTSELAIELAFGRGDWDHGIAVGEQAIDMARALSQPMLLARLLVWTALIHLGRGDYDRGRRLTDEAWQLAVGRDDEPGQDAAASKVVPAASSVHAVIPAHIGKATYHLVTGDFQAAMEVADAGLAVVDRTGYDVWAVHRLLPVAAEAALQSGMTKRAASYGARLREVAERLDHRLGLAWADACDAIRIWLEGDPAAGALLMREAADRLDEVPFLPDATRLRRQLAGRLVEVGDIDGARRELLLVHDKLARLGARKELERTRAQFQEIDVRPPPRQARGSGALGLTPAELRVARAVAADKSNKAVARQLNMAERTVTTHLTNIYRKLGIPGRKPLASVLRAAELRGDLPAQRVPRARGKHQKTLKET